MPKHKLYAMRMNVDRWLSSAFIRGSDLAVTGAYINLLMAAWSEDDCMLPSDPNKLKKLANAESDEVWAVVWPELRGKFRRRNGKLYNEVQMDEFERSAKIYKTKVDNGKKNTAGGIAGGIAGGGDNIQHTTHKLQHTTDNNHNSKQPQKLCDLLGDVVVVSEPIRARLYCEFSSWLSDESWQISQPFFDWAFQHYPDINDLMDQLRNQRDPEKCRAKDVPPIDSPGAVLRTVVTKWAKDNNVTIPRGI